MTNDPAPHWSDVQTLPTVGTYTVIADVDGDKTSTITFQVSNPPPDAVAGPAVIDGPPVTLATTERGQVATTTFTTTTTNQKVQWQTGPPTAGTAVGVRVLRPDGSAMTNDPAPHWSDVQTLPTVGTYTVIADVDGDKTSTITFQVSNPPPPGAASQTRSARAAARVSTTARPGAGTVVARNPRLRFELLTMQLTTAAAARSSRPSWSPDRRSLNGGDWLLRIRSPRVPKDLLARLGATALSGHVLTFDGRGLAGVSVKVGARVTTTDRSGRFLLTRLDANATTAVVDGTPASRPGARYGLFRIRIKPVSGRTVSMPGTVWMPALDTQHMVRLVAPTTKETVLTTPAIPGLEVRIPAGSVVRDLQGNIVHELGITPIPLDRTPYPLPKDTRVPVYFTVQPGGTAVFPQGAQIVYPNYTHLPAGKVVDFLAYDPEGAGWHAYGKGKVSADGKQVVPDASTRVWVFDGAMFDGNDVWAWLTKRLVDVKNWVSGDPVDLGTGKLLDTHTDLAVRDIMPITLSRAYWQGDGRVREFGQDQVSTYNMFLQSEKQYEQVDLYAPGEGSVHFVRTSSGTGWTDAVFTATGTPSQWRGATIQWETNVAGISWRLTRADGTTFYFPEFSRLRYIRDRDGNQITITRNGGNNGEISEIRSPNGRFIRLTYGSGNRVATARDNIGRTVSYAYDGNGRLTTVTDVGGGVTTYAWDTSNRITSITDPSKVVYLSNQYDADGRVSHQTLPGGATYDFAYETSSGAVTATRVTQPNGSVRRVTFDTDGAVTSDTACYGTISARTTTYERVTDKRISSVVDANGRRTVVRYDDVGRAVGTTILAGTADEAAQGTVTYGAFDLPVTVTDAAGKVTRYAYDDRGNLTKIVDAEGRTTSLVYDESGHVTRTTDPGGGVITYGYTNGTLSSIKDPVGRTSSFFTDGAGRLVALVDPTGSRVTREYDAFNQVRRVIDPLGHAASYTYDTEGNVTTFTDARGKQTRWAYDEAGDVVSATDPLGRTSTYEYDAAGHPVVVLSRSGKRTEISYDALDRRTKIRYGVSGSAEQSSADFTYDAYSRLSRIVDSAAGTASLTYDARDRMTRVSKPGGDVTHAYDPLDRTVATTSGSAPEVTYGYDDTGLLTRAAQDGKVVTLGYDGAGRQTTVNLPGAWQQARTFDDADQLTKITYKHDGAEKGSIEYGYDGSGRRSSVGGDVADVALPDARAGMSYDDANRLVQVGGVTLSYDADGNLTADGTTSYTWNARGQLTGLSRTGLSANFGYDLFGDRTSRTVGSTTTGFLAPGANQAVESRDGSVDATLLSGGVDQWFARTKGGETDAVLTDALGSPVALGDSSGGLRARYAYHPFGGSTVTGDVRGADLGFTGRQDDGTGLMYYRDRYYSPSLGRFISEDPTGLSGGDNLYAYALDAPTVYTDPSGDNPLVGCLVGGAIGGGISYLEQRLSGRKVDWGWSGVGGQALVGCAFGAGGWALRAARAGAGTGAAAADDWPVISGIVRDAAKGKGNFGIGAGTSAQAEAAGRAWVGAGARLASDGRTWLSRDGLRQWRPPSYKPRLGKWQSNLESRLEPSGQWQTNGHLDVVDLP